MMVCDFLFPPVRCYFKERNEVRVMLKIVNVKYSSTKNIFELFESMISTCNLDSPMWSSRKVNDKDYIGYDHFFLISTHMMLNQ